MEDEELSGYFLKLLGLRLRLKAFPSQNLPYFLSGLFSFKTGEIERCKLLFCFPKADEIPTPAQLKAYEADLRGRTGLEPVFVFSDLSSWDRQRLIEGRLAFVVPNKQLYLPTLLIDLREHFAQTRRKAERLSFPAQYLVIDQLLHASIEGQTVRELSRVLTYSATSMSRAFEELVTLGLAETEPGKSRPVHFIHDRKGLWTTALSYLQSPVKKRWYWMGGDVHPQWPRAGISALARQTMLNEDAQDCFALEPAEIKTYINQGKVGERPRNEQDPLLEVWGYAPRGLCGENGENVDPFSLYLSLRGENDERVRTAIENLLAGVL